MKDLQKDLRESMDPTIGRLVEAFDHLSRNTDNLIEMNRSLQTFNLIFGNLIHSLQNESTSLELINVMKFSH
jgi:hypothetical protein